MKPRRLANVLKKTLHVEYTQSLSNDDGSAPWDLWDGGIYLVAPTNDVQQGEYGLVDTELLEQLEYFKQRPGRACLIIIVARSD